MEPYELNAPQQLPHATRDNINFDTVSKGNRWHGKQLAPTFQDSTKNNLHISIVYIPEILQMLSLLSALLQDLYI